ncbi:riboflavin kinase/FAD synthetase [Spiroplasma helicoides]|uniref:riboflavin kinase n=1 Tax=Spiroplasma helicoides TaxID=216938 RepID=A0A1B3SKS7_9MOLU|nr:riboflavin kinase [Spiroplasma helicoides]AOG60523.1 riboflavin kinase/FAD synthetase [Spiroplasma helicoides]
MSNVINYNNLSRILLNLDDSIALVSDFQNWNEFEDRMIIKLKNVANKLGIKTTIFIPTISETDYGIWNKKNIVNLANEHKIDQVIFYINRITNNKEEKQYIYENIKNMLSIKNILISDNFKLDKSYYYDTDFFVNFWKENCIVFDNFLNKANPLNLYNLLKTSNFLDFKKITKLDYQFSGRVVEGKKLGRKIGFPTANIVTQELLPIDNGVFICEVFIEAINESYLGAGCYWNNELKQKVFEVNIINFNKDIYGWLIDIKILKKIRDEVKVNSLDQLKELLKSDVDYCKNYINRKEET